MKTKFALCVLMSTSMVIGAGKDAKTKAPAQQSSSAEVLPTIIVADPIEKERQQKRNLARYDDIRFSKKYLDSLSPQAVNIIYQEESAKVEKLRKVPGFIVDQKKYDAYTQVLDDIIRKYEKIHSRIGFLSLQYLADEDTEKNNEKEVEKLKAQRAELENLMAGIRADRDALVTKRLK